MMGKFQPNRMYHADGRVTTFQTGNPPISQSNPESAQPTEYHRVDSLQSPNTVSVVSGVVVPILQTIITAILWALVAPVGRMLVIEYTEFDYNPWPLFFLIALAAMILQWHSLLGEWRDLLHPFIGEESFVNTGDPTEQEPTLQHVKVQVSSEDGKSSSFLDLPISSAKLGTFAIGISRDGTTAESAWVGSQQLFNRAEYIGLRDALISRGYAVWNSPNSHDRGWRLTAKGHSTFKGLAEKYQQIGSR